MKEHAIPQDITGYKFHIVGNMTLKQFAETALGVVIAFFIYKTNLIAPVKWTLAIFSAALGAMLAFMPIEERPLDHWFLTFFTILYKPTKYYWKKRSKVPEAFLYQSNQQTKNHIDETDLSPQRRERISEYLQSVKISAPIDQYELYEQQRSSQLLSIFNDRELKIDFGRAEKLMKRPKLKVETHSLVGSTEKNDTEQLKVKPIVEVGRPDSRAKRPTADLTPIKTYGTAKRKLMSTDQVAAAIEIPELENIRVEDTQLHSQQQLGSNAAEINEQAREAKMTYDTHDAFADKPNSTSQALVNKDLPFPIKPTKPNKLVGMVLTPENDLINQATITLRDNAGKPVTAVKSNALGQFFVTSQLPNGTYTIEVSKEDNTFRPLQIVLEGKVVDPLEIRSNE